ncbi:MAG: tripartite tricarboxylate transporter TctB family protein [Desulfopila sp.]
MSEKRANWDSFTGLFSIFFGLVYGLAAWNMPRAAFGNPQDPLYFPLGVAGLAVIVGIILTIRSSFSASIQALQSVLGKGQAHSRYRRHIALTCLAGIGYAFFFDRFGYLISTALFMFAMLTITSGWRRWLRNALVAAFFSGGIYFVFSTLLSVSLPPLPFME